MTRTAGSLNKNTMLLKKRLEKLNCDPIEALVRVGKRAETEGDLKTASRCFADLAAFVQPKLRSVELTGADGGPAYVAYMPQPASSAAEWSAQHGPKPSTPAMSAVVGEESTDGNG